MSYICNQNQQSQAQEQLGDMFLLDTGSTFDSIVNPDFVTEIRASKHGLQMATNAGVKRVTTEADVPGYGRTWYNNDGIANIFSFANMKDKHRVTYDSAKEDAFLIHVSDNKIVKFKRSPEGLYGFKPGADFVKEVAEFKGQLPSADKPTEMGVNNLISTVSEN